jgi:hypothetical protein
LLLYLLRSYHIRKNPVGRTAGLAFTVYQGLSAAFWLGSATLWKEYEMRPLWYVVGWHALWTVGGAWGLLKAE